MGWTVENKTCLVTGGAGFIGSHLVELLLELGNEVYVLDDLSTGSLANLRDCSGNNRLKIRIGSVEDVSLVRELVSRVDVVFHLASAVGVGLVASRPVESVRVNAFGTEVVLRAALERGCRVLIASSSEVYGKSTSVPFRESGDLVFGPSTRVRWSYGVSKVLGEFLGLAYHREYGLPVVCARLFNTIGPRQSGQYGMVVPRFVARALRNEPLLVYGDGSQSRCFCSVHDVVTALVGLAAHPSAVGEVFNVGSTEEITIDALARLIIQLAGSASRIEYVPFEKVYGEGVDDMQRRVPDISKIKSVLGWEPCWSLRETLVEILDWMRREVF